MPSSRHPGAALLRASAVLAACALAPAALAQWNPTAGQWGKSAPGDLRVMTWNVLDTICSTNVKNNAGNNWAAVARIVAAMQPDVLILQECGDNSGNGTGSNVDSVANLAATVGMFLHGGTDTFRGGTVTQYVQAFAPGYDLPFVFASFSTDGFNRNAVLSRFPFVDLNGDGKETLSNMPTVSADLYAPGGTGGLRGYLVAEIDLPDALYAGDLVVGNSHLKAGTSAADHDQRVKAAQNIAYFLDHLYNGAGLGLPDPFGTIADVPPATSILGSDTLVVTGGDWNEDEDVDGSKGPAEWITRAAVADAAGGTDGTDRDRSDMLFDAALDPLSGASATLGPFKFDAIAWQDSIAELQRAFLFNSATLPFDGSATPPELAGFPGGAQTASGLASDHRPVVIDLALPRAECNDAVDLGLAKPGGSGLAPRFTVCGSLASGGTADVRLQDAAPRAPAWLVASLAPGGLPFAGGVLVPLPDFLVGPFATDAAGTLEFASVPGGGGPLLLYAQWIVLDPGASFGKSLSNALLVAWLP